MKFNRICILAAIPLLILHIFGVFSNIEWIAKLSQILIFIPLLFGFYKRLDFGNQNFSLFLSLSITSVILQFFESFWYLNVFSSILLMVSYFFLSKEALKFTQRKNANRYMKFYFFLLIAMNCYFMVNHLLEMEKSFSNAMYFVIYSIYYLNLLVLAIIALIYYLNSYSKKSVFFISLVLSIILADVLRDMALYYLKDTSVLVIESILRFAIIILAFKFFITKEKKLRLLNLV